MIIDGGEWDIFINNNRDVLQRFRANGVFANARKCKWGFPLVEFVGHQVDETGLTFSKEKLEGVLKVRKPDTLKQLRSSIGLASYFRDHVRDFVSLAHPLQQLLNRGLRTLEIQWTSRRISFSCIKEGHQ